MTYARLSGGKLLALLLFATLTVLPATLHLAHARAAASDVKDKVTAQLTAFVPVATRSAVTLSAVTFIHPGIGLDKTLLDNMRDHVRAADEPWASAFIQFSSISSAKTVPLMRIFSDTARDYVNIPSGGLNTDGYYIVRNMAQDAHTALVQTLMWYVTGNAIYRQNAMKLLRQWNQVQSIGNIYDEQIRVSLAVYQFAYAAEILKSTAANSAADDWSASDNAGFLSLLNLMMSKYNRYTHFMNQHGMCAMAAMASAVFRNDATAYATAIQRATTNPEAGASYDFTVPGNPHNRDGAIFSQIREVTTDVSTGASVAPNIQLVEMGRDQGHPYVSIGALSAIAMTGYLQGSRVDPVAGTLTTAANGVRIFGFLDHRLLYGANYLARYNLGNDVPWIPTYSETTGAIYTAPTTVDRGTLQTTLGALYGYYKYVEKRPGLETDDASKYLAEAFSKMYPEGDSQDFVGHGVLLYTLDDKSNLASDATVSASSSTESGGWGRGNVVDGLAASDAAALGWSGSATPTVDHVEWLVFDTGSVGPINQVDLYPRTDGANAGQGFPIAYTIDLSIDGNSWTSVVSRTAQPLPTGVQGFNFAYQQARYVRVRGSSLRPNPLDANRYRMQLAEVRIFGKYASAGASVLVSSQQSGSDWAPARAVDGLRSTGTDSKGWSSTSGGASVTEWLMVDLGDIRPVGELTLYPRTDGANAGYGYPVNLAVELSLDGVTWTTVASRTALALPSAAAAAGQTFSFGYRPSRYVRIQGTVLRANPNDGGTYRMQLAEVEVY